MFLGGDSSTKKIYKLNDKADAFKHAFWMGMNERDCGENHNNESIAYLFGVAHESEDPAVLHLETEMDLFNNSVGVSVGSYWFPIFVSDATVASDVIAKLNNGELKYLDPLDFLASPQYDSDHNKVPDCSTCLDGIISATQLKPTNQ